MQNAHIIETALLLLIAFLIGCAIGWFVRTRFYRTAEDNPSASPAATPGPAQASAPATSAEPAPAAVEPAAMVTPDAAKPATKKPASKKAAPKKTAAKKPAAKKATAKPAAPVAPAATEAGKPQGLSAPRAGGKDDLKRISGVGPKLEEKLNGLGIFHFDQIAEWDSQTIDWVDDHLSFKGRIARDKWVDQAKTLANQK